MTRLISMGSDPEYFVTKKNKIIPGTPSLIPGTKKDPYKLTRQVSIQLDNVLAEVTHVPGRTSGNFASLVYSAFDVALDFLADRGMSIAPTSSYVFQEDQLQDPHCKVFGCEPDFSADYRDPVTPIDPTKAGGLRTASGHIHLGFDNTLNMYQKIMLVKILDATLALPLLKVNNDPRRRTLYGQASRFRNTPYGIEYRTLDNSWTFFPTELAASIFSTTHHNVTALKNTQVLRAIDGIHPHIAEAINTGKGDINGLLDEVANTGVLLLHVGDLKLSSSKLAEGLKTSSKKGKQSGRLKSDWRKYYSDTFFKAVPPTMTAVGGDDSLQVEIDDIF